MPKQADEFRRVYVALLAGTLLTAVALPERVGGRLRAVGATAFRPVAQASYEAAGALLGFGDDAARAPAFADAFPPGGVVVKEEAPPAVELPLLRDENERLRLAVANLTGRLDAMAALARERARLGPVAELCEPARVVGVAAGARSGLIVAGSFEPGSPVLYAAGVAGRTDGPSSVRLLTDAGLKFGAAFGRYSDDALSGPTFRALPTEPPVVRGTGGGMEVERARLDDLQSAGVRVGDWVVLDDPDWPAPLRDWRVGTVASIEPIPSAPGFARVGVDPPRDLTQLREVMVYVGGGR